MAIRILLMAALTVAITKQQEPVQFGPTFAQIGPFRIDIKDEGKFVPWAPTNFTNLGPVLGNILNFHYFPAVNLYEAGRYADAFDNFNFFITDRFATDDNPNQASWMSTAHHLRGMILRYHATGVGRLTLARGEFEAAIKWNAKNFPAYLELSRVLSIAGLKDQAASVLRSLLDLRPDDEEVVEDAKNELNLVLAKPQPPADNPAPSSEQSLGNRQTLP